MFSVLSFEQHGWQFDFLPVSFLQKIGIGFIGEYTVAQQFGGKVGWVLKMEETCTLTIKFLSCHIFNLSFKSTNH